MLEAKQISKETSDKWFSAAAGKMVAKRWLRYRGTCATCLFQFWVLLSRGAQRLCRQEHNFKHFIFHTSFCMPILFFHKVFIVRWSTYRCKDFPDISATWCSFILFLRKLLFQLNLTAGKSGSCRPSVVLECESNTEWIHAEICSTCRHSVKKNTNNSSSVSVMQISV